MRKRVFIVAPTAHGEALGDKIHHVCLHNGKLSIDACYNADKFDVIADRLSLKGAVACAKRLGAKRPAVI